MAKKQSHRLAHEVAEASRAPKGARRASYPNELIEEARRLQRLLGKRTRLRRELKKVDNDIRLSKRTLKALAGATERAIEGDGGDDL